MVFFRLNLISSSLDIASVLKIDVVFRYFNIFQPSLQPRLSDERLDKVMGALDWNMLHGYQVVATESSEILLGGSNHLTQIYNNLR